VAFKILSGILGGSLDSSEIRNLESGVIFNLVRVTAQDNLSKLVDDINRASWDQANEMSSYDVSDLQFYLDRQDTIFVVCYDSSLEQGKLLGMASSRLEVKPYGQERWLYVDELDVCADERRRGVGKFIMQKLIELAEEQGCEELWLGAEADNQPANSLYRSLDPDDVSNVMGYTYETDD